MRSSPLSILSLFVCSLIGPGAGPASAQPPTLTGVVVDPSGRAVPRAVVRVSAGGRDAVTVFSSADGTFEVPSPGAGCVVHVTLSGFEPVRTACESSTMRITLPLAAVGETIVVTARRSEAPAGQVASSVTVFEAAAIDRRQQPLVADLLRAAPGVRMVTVGGIGNVTSLFVRGGESNYTKVLLDGIPLNEPGGAFNFSNVTTEGLDRVEFVRGAHSALFGSDAMAGVVQMVTRRAAPGRPRARVGLDGGGLGTIRGSASAAAAAGRFDVSAHAARFETDNHVPNNRFENTTLGGAAGVQLSPRASLRFVGRAELGRTGVPGATAFGRPDLDASFQRRDGVGGVTFDQQLTPAFRHRATYALAATRQTSTNLIADPPYLPRFGDRTGAFEFSDFTYDSHTKLNRHHAAYQADWRIASGSRTGTHLLTAAVEWDGERATLTNRLAGSATRASRDNAGYTVQHQVLWPRVFVTGGLRVEDNESFGVSVSPAVSLAWVAAAGPGARGATTLRASAGAGVKEPTILQSYSPTPSFLGNPDLEPERARTFEAGLTQRLWDDRLKVDAAWFDNRFRDIISTRTISLSPFVSQFFNVGLTRARGAELTLDAAPARWLQARGGYTFLDSRLLRSTAPSNPVFREGQWAFRRPRHSGFAEAVVHIRRVEAALFGTFVGRTVDSDFAALQPAMLANDGHTRWDLRATGRLTPRLDVLAAVDNLGGARYMEPLGYPAAGRTGRVGLQVRF